MIDSDQLRNLIIKPSLEPLGLLTNDSEELLFAICCHESHKGSYVKQVNGCALGIYQMEPDTYYDIFDNFLKYKSNLKSRVFNFLNIKNEPNANELITNMKLATIMARIFFLRNPEKIPPYNNINEIANYWKKYYNTAAGKGDQDKFISDYRRFK
jgi:hypothetical protein